MSRLFLLALLAGCATPREYPISVPAETIGIQLGPAAATQSWPRVFVSGQVEDSALIELVPYVGKRMVLNGAASEVRCAQWACQRLIETRPDAVFAIPSSPQITGVSSSVFATPFGTVPVTTVDQSTTFVAFAMRAMPAALPFTYNLVSGTVLDVVDKTAIKGGMLEGDTITKIDGADPLPPKDWPKWQYYSRILQHAPGDEVAIEWVRSGTGKMSGTVRLCAPRQPHLAVPDSIDVRFMPEIEEAEVDGRFVWRMASQPWAPYVTEDDFSARTPRVRANLNKPGT
ncbi:MAG: hypothetical protein JNK15_22060 [Planctomycetes bacterium]|nr:hypothetical protein [Planctomycetota bacterium]